MRREVIKVTSEEDERPFHLMVTREDTDQPNVEEVVVAFMMGQEERMRLVEYLTKIEDIEDVVGFSIAFGVRIKIDPSGGLKFFSDNIKKL